MAKKEETVLLEYKGLRSEIKLDRNQLCSIIEEELCLINHLVKVRGSSGMNGIVIILAQEAWADWAGQEEAWVGV